jgi:hypothetical protein
VELTEVRTGGRDWWTLGFEATGPADLLRSELQATVALVFAQALPGGVQPGPDESSSYAQWLSLRPGAGSTRMPEGCRFAESASPPFVLACLVPAQRGRRQATLPPRGHIETVRLVLWVRRRSQVRRLQHDRWGTAGTRMILFRRRTLRQKRMSGLPG